MTKENKITTIEVAVEDLYRAQEAIDKYLDDQHTTGAHSNTSYIFKNAPSKARVGYWRLAVFPDDQRTSEARTNVISNIFKDDANKAKSVDLRLAALAQLAREEYQPDDPYCCFARDPDGSYWIPEGYWEAAAIASVFSEEHGAYFDSHDFFIHMQIASDIKALHTD